MKKQKIKNSKGITLIALVITIIILLLLAGITISQLTGSGLFEKTIKAADESKISEYKEKIELIKMELLIEKNGVPPTIQEIKQELDKENYKSWVNSTRFITDNDIEKLELTTKEGYIFYITSEKTQYKGEGEVVDTSALQRDDVISIQTIEAGDTINKVQITDLSGVDYYKLKYQIGSTEGEWTEIESGDIVEVPYGTTIYARLEYETEVGQNHQISISDSMPKIVAQNINTSDLERKTDKALGELFEITWGSDGTGTIKYDITGNLTFNNTSFNSTEINNLSDLELGTYTIKCTITSPKNNVATASKTDVKVTKLKETTVQNSSGIKVTAKAIYSGYDLANFRDLVNNGQPTLNAKLMNDIDLANVCSATIGSWIPIGNYRTTDAIDFDEVANATIYYGGTFDGNSKIINNIYINGATLYRQGLFSLVKENGYIKILTISGNITGYQTVGGIAGSLYKGRISNCINNVNVNVTNQNAAGIAGTNDGTVMNCKNNSNINSNGPHTGGIIALNRGKISNCINVGEVKTTGGVTEGGVPVGSFAGGITGINEGTITKCMNKGNITATYRVNGGIAGRNYGTISYCANSGNVTGELVIGGIVGNNRGYIEYVYNISDEIKATLSTLGVVGGITGNQNNTSDAYVKYAYNKSKIIGYSDIGGIAGQLSIGTISNVYNMGNISATSTTNVGQVYGYTYSTSAVTNSNSTTEATMKGWDQATINTNIGSGFKKKTNGLPIFNITVHGVTF